MARKPTKPKKPTTAVKRAKRKKPPTSAKPNKPRPPKATASQAEAPSALTWKGGYASFWIGRFSSEEELEEFINSSSFEQEQGFSIEAPLLPFHAYDKTAQPAQVMSLLMREPRVLEAALKALNKLPNTSFNALIRHEGFHYDPAAAPSRKTRRMTFLGSFKTL